MRCPARGAPGSARIAGASYRADGRRDSRAAPPPGSRSQGYGMALFTTTPVMTGAVSVFSSEKNFCNSFRSALAT